MTQTVSEMETERRVRLERAQRYEALLNQQVQLRRAIECLEGGRVNLDALRQIHVLCGEVPATVMTKSTSSLGWTVPSNMEVRAVLMQVAGNALGYAQLKQAERDAELAKARTTLAAVESELATFA